MGQHEGKLDHENKAMNYSTKSRIIIKQSKVTLGIFRQTNQ